MSEPNWSVLVTELNERGWSQKEIGDRVGCDQSHISDLKTGRQTNPRYSVGQALLRLHADVLSGQALPQPPEQQVAA